MEKDYIIVDANRQVAPDVTHKTEALLFNVNQLFKKKKKVLFSHVLAYITM